MKWWHSAMWRVSSRIFGAPGPESEAARERKVRATAAKADRVIDDYRKFDAVLHVRRTH